MVDSTDTAAGSWLLDGLTDAQIEAVTSPHTPLVVLAGPGSGKTTTLTRRIAYQAAVAALAPERVLALTFTRAAARELITRLGRLGLGRSVTAGTFHSVAYAQLRDRWAVSNIAPPGLIADRVDFIGRRGCVGGGVSPEQVDAEIGWAKARLHTPENYLDAIERADRYPPAPAELLAACFARYERVRRERRMVDFDDLLRLCARHLRRDGEHAAAVRWRFRHLFVDEVQDLNPAQHELLTAWLGERTDLCVVGDPDQAIYGWNGADPAILATIASLPDATVVELRETHRLTPQLAGVADHLLACDSNRPARPLLLPTAEPGPVPTLRALDTDLDEAAAVAQAVRDEHAPGHPWSDQAVLVRTHARAHVVERALTRAGIPCRMPGRRIPAGARMSRALRLLGHADRPLRHALPDLHSQIMVLSQPRADRRDHDDLVDGPVEHPDLRPLLALVELISYYRSLSFGADEPTVAEFRMWLSTESDEGLDGTDAVEIVTFHAAKGREWRCVHLAGLHDLAGADDPSAADHAEERRLLFVALTRARERVHLTWAARRDVESSTPVGPVPSPFIADIETGLHIQELRASRDEPSWREHMHRARGQLPRTAWPSTLHRALSSWRDRVARAHEVQPSAVLGDEVLDAIATTRPATVDELVEAGLDPMRCRLHGITILELADAS